MRTGVIENASELMKENSLVHLYSSPIMLNRAFGTISFGNYGFAATDFQAE